MTWERRATARRTSRFKVGDDFTVKTWNNSIGDAADNTLIGQERNGIREASLSEQGAMMDPEFIIRLSATAKR